MREAVAILAVVASAAGADGAGRRDLQSGPYVVALSAREATVCWQTERPAAGSVRYAPVVRMNGGGKWIEVRGPVGSTTLSGRRGAGRLARFHALRLVGLAPATRYEARVRVGAVEAGTLSFGTAPEPVSARDADAFTFFVYGDTRTHSRDHARVARAVAAEADRIRQRTFVVHTGDFAARGSDEAETAEQFFRPAAPVLSKMVLVPVKGNHELGTDLFDRYFPVPEPPEESSGAREYCFDYGPVRLVVLDQFARASVEARTRWLARKLEEAKNRWRVVAFHEPVYSSGRHGSNRRWRALVEPVLCAGKVHAAFSGHDHNYERTRPVGSPEWGVTYFTTGGGGAPLYARRGGAREWSARFERVHHFLSVRVTKEAFTVTAFAVDRKTGLTRIIDSVAIPWR